MASTRFGENIGRRLRRHSQERRAAPHLVGEDREDRAALADLDLDQRDPLASSRSTSGYAAAPDPLGGPKVVTRRSGARVGVAGRLS